MRAALCLGLQPLYGAAQILDRIGVADLLGNQLLAGHAGQLKARRKPLEQARFDEPGPQELEVPRDWKGPSVDRAVHAQGQMTGDDRQRPISQLPVRSGVERLDLVKNFFEVIEVQSAATDWQRRGVFDSHCKIPLV